MDMSFQIALSKMFDVVNGIGGPCGQRENLDKTDIYEFGVYRGDSMSYMKNVFMQSNWTPKTIFGFDSFDGFPEDTEDIVSNSMWPKGAMNMGDFFKNKTPEEIAEEIKHSIKDDTFNLEFIVGFYDDVLIDDVVETQHMKSALFVNFDCDQYLSTYQALDFMFRNNLIVKDTIIRYDDWNSGLIYNNDEKIDIKSPFLADTWIEGESGQSKAHKEILEKYGVYCTRIYQDSPRFNWKGKSVFVVEEIK